VETSQEIIDHYNPSGIGKAGFFLFQGIKVCPKGQREAIVEELNRQLGQINHPGEARVNQPENTGTPQYVGGHGGA